MSIRPSPKASQAWSLIDLMVGVSVFAICAMALGSISLFSFRSYAAMANYALLDQYNRQAMDQLTYELRQAQKITSYTTNSTSSTLNFINGSGVNVAYTFDSSRQRVTRSGSDGSSKILLTNCNLLNFGLYMRPPTNGSFDVYPVNMGSNWQQTVKVVQLTWKTSMTISPTAQVNSEDIQTARIIIRKQQDN
jgi:hypothetical protein